MNQTKNWRGYPIEVREGDPESKSYGMWGEARLVSTDLSPSPEPIVQKKGHMPVLGTWGSVRELDGRDLPRADIVAFFHNQDLCDDEGCPHSAIDHVCINNVERPAAVYCGVEMSRYTI